MTPDTKEKIELFRTWLECRGAEILPTKGQWELLRWRAPEGDGVRIAHTNKKGGISGFGSDQALNDWSMCWDDLGRGEPAPVLPTITPATARPGNDTALSSVGPGASVGDSTVLRYTGESYVGADITDSAGRWVANIHGTSGRKNKPIPGYERNIWLFCNAEKMAQLLMELTDRGVSHADLPRLEHLGREVQEFLKGLPDAST